MNASEKAEADKENKLMGLPRGPAILLIVAIVVIFIVAIIAYAAFRHKKMANY